MIGGPVPKLEILWNGLTASNGATVGGTAVPYIDMLGYNYLELTVIATTSDAATNNPSVMKLQVSDTGSATHASNTGWTDVTPLVGDGTGGFTIPDCPTATTVKPYALMRFDKRTGGGKRYARLVLSPLTTHTYTVLARLSNGSVMPDSASEANVAVLAQG